MIFLIRYDRDQGQRVALKRFHDDRRAEAEQARFKLELEINQQNLNHEVVILDAASEAALRITHSRYFDDVDKMIERLASSTSAFVVREKKD